MAHRERIEPRVEGLESRAVLSHVAAHPMAQVAAAATTAGITGTIAVQGNVSYNTTNGVNVVTINGRGALSPFGKSVGVEVVVAQVATADGGVYEVGGMFFLTPKGPQFASLTPVTPPSFVAGGFTLPVVAQYATVPGVGGPGNYVGDFIVYSGSKGTLMTFG